MKVGYPLPCNLRAIKLSSCPNKQHRLSSWGDVVVGVWAGRRHSLRVYLVKGAIHAHCGPEPCQLLVLPETCQDGRQGSRTEIGRAERDNGADVLDSNAVSLGGFQA